MPVSQKVIDGLEKCKIIALDSVGTDLVDVPAATAKGIPVTNCPDTFVQEVAEHTAALILAAHRRLLLVDRMVREDRWAEGRPALCQLPRLYGQTLGLISFGNIARAVVPLMKPFGLRILAHDPFVRETVIVQHGVEPVGLTELLQRSDIISNHLPGTGGTRRMIGEEQFRLMKPLAIFVNTGRGSTVDEAAMTRALQEGLIGHAALDVLEMEPPDPRQSPPRPGERDIDGPRGLGIIQIRGRGQDSGRKGDRSGVEGTLAHVLRESVGAGQLRPAEVATRVAEGPHPHPIIKH